jgi:predicted ATP-grasp superfamily ATP-dependent carboligase
MTSSVSINSRADPTLPAAVRNLLVLGSSLTALAVARAAYQKRLRCVLLDNVAGPAVATRMASFRRLEADDMASLCRVTADFAHGNDVAVIADSDRWLRFVRKHRDSLSGQGWRVLHPNTAAIDVCLDKSAFLRWCSAHGLPAPRWYDASNIEAVDDGAYPLILRPEWTQHSSGGRLPKAIEIGERKAMRLWLERFAAAGVEPSICESLLRPGLRQFSVGAARDAAGRVRTFLAEKVRPHAEQCAGGTFVRPATLAAVEELAATALHTLDFFGVAEVEVLFDPTQRRAYLVEINARPWLQYGLPFKCGCDLLGQVLEDRTDRVDTSNRSHAWLYFSPDLYACFSRSSGLVSTGKLSLAGYVRSLACADVHATWDWRDPAPFIASACRTVGSYLRRTLLPRPPPHSRT